MKEIIVFDQPSCGKPLSINESNLVASGGEDAVYVGFLSGKKIASRIAVFLDGVRNQSFGKKRFAQFFV